MLSRRTNIPKINVDRPLEPLPSPPPEPVHVMSARLPVRAKLMPRRAAGEPVTVEQVRETNNIVNAQIARVRTEDRRKNGLCGRCGKVKSLTFSCDPCREKINANRRARGGV